MGREIESGPVHPDPSPSAHPAIAAATVSAGGSGAVGRDDFCARFKAKMLAVAGPAFDDGESIAEYADETAPTYFETDWQREMGPEECALSDISYWGD